MLIFPYLIFSILSNSKFVHLNKIRQESHRKNTGHLTEHKKTPKIAVLEAQGNKKVPVGKTIYFPLHKCLSQLRKNGVTLKKKRISQLEKKKNQYKVLIREYTNPKLLKDSVPLSTHSRSYHGPENKVCPARGALFKIFHEIPNHLHNRYVCHKKNLPDCSRLFGQNDE